MCGQIGVIFGTKRRSREEINHLLDVFTKALVSSERRGPHATGVAWVNSKGGHRLYKQPVPASRFVRDQMLHDVLSGVDNSTTVLMGHTRWKTRGDERNNANNHPIHAGDVIGTHNGHIANADDLFRTLNLPRFADVDSEIIFRIADSILDDGVIQIMPLIHGLSLCQGQMSAVMVSKGDPETIIVAKGDKPLEFRYHRQCRALFYASEDRFMDVALNGQPGWMPLYVPSMNLVAFHCRSVTHLCKRLSLHKWALGRQNDGVCWPRQVCWNHCVG